MRTPSTSRWTACLRRPALDRRTVSDYNSVFWLVEMSGIPFGLMSEMLDAHNVFRGMVFGILPRHALERQPGSDVARARRFRDRPGEDVRLLGRPVIRSAATTN